MRADESKVERVGGITLFVVSLLLLFVIIPFQIKDITSQGVPPRFVPQAVSIVLLVLSVFLYRSGHKKKGKKNLKIYSINKQELRLSLITLIVVAVSIVLYQYIGFIFTTIIQLAFLMYMFGQRNKLKIVLVSILLPILINLFFKQVLMINLPLFNLF